MAPPAVDLYWLPVAAGTSRFQRASLRLWEAVEAKRARRPMATLFHAALKLRPDDSATFTLELMPAFVASPAPPLATGPVGVRGADRWRLFRYQLCYLPAEELPDEQWAVQSPVHLSDNRQIARRVVDLAPTVPRHVWGRRVPGTNEMWTSDSIISWLLIRAGADLSNIDPPPGGRAPGWEAGKALARSQSRSHR